MSMIAAEELDALRAERDRLAAGLRELAHDSAVMIHQLNALLEQACKDLNGAHDELMVAQGVSRADVGKYDWPEWTPQANTIRDAEKLLGKRLAKTNAWTHSPEVSK